MERKEREKFPDSKPSIEKPFKMYNDANNITVWLRPEELAKNGWQLDQTNATQVKRHTKQFSLGVGKRLVKDLKLVYSGMCS